MSEWQSIETAPKDGTAVLLWFPDSADMDESAGPHRARWIGDLWWMEGHHCGGQLTKAWSRPTHWQALPSPPETSR